MEPKKKGVDLAIIFGGKPSKGGPKPPLRSSSDDDDESDAEHDDLPPGFETAAIEAFPDLEGDPERLAALKRAIAACTGSYDDDE